MKQRSPLQSPYVWVPLTGIQQDIVRHESQRWADGWMLRTTSAVGQMICSQVQPADTRQPSLSSKDGLKLYIPLTGPYRHLIDSHWLSVSPFGVRQIAAYIDAWFRLVVRQWFFEGRQRGYTQKQICEAVIGEYGFWSSADNFSLIKKMDFRERRKLTAEVQAALAPHCCGIRVASEGGSGRPDVKIGE